VIGGDDLTDHGSVDVNGNVELGWLYMRRVLELFSGNTSRGDGSIAALGSAAAPETTNSDAGAAITAAAQEAGYPVTFYDGDVAINQFFADLASASANPSVIWIPGNGAQNDLRDGPGDEAAALTANAPAIAGFVAGGGGLFAHGTEFGWLTALVSDVTAVDGGNVDDLYFTPEGAAALSGLELTDINAGPWHSHFEGDFGGLEVLVRFNAIDDAGGQDAAVVIGGMHVLLGPDCDAPPSPDQLNSDSNFTDQTPPSLQDDRTWPNSDAIIDACDIDDDNDGVPDLAEAAGCNSSGPLSPKKRDTDGDRTLDGAECALGTNPTSAASKPTVVECATFLGVGPAIDTDGDRIPDGVEYCGYNTDRLLPDTDGDQDALPLRANPSLNLIKDGGGVGESGSRCELCGSADGRARNCAGDRSDAAAGEYGHQQGRRGELGGSTHVCGIHCHFRRLRLKRRNSTTASYGFDLWSASQGWRELSARMPVPAAIPDCS
jgi:hypothetical protein